MTNAEVCHFEPNDAYWQHNPGGFCKVRHSNERQDLTEPAVNLFRCLRELEQLGLGGLQSLKERRFETADLTKRRFQIPAP